MSEILRGSLSQSEAGIETGERVSLDRLASMADMAVAIMSYAEGSMDLTQSRQIVADAAENL